MDPKAAAQIRGIKESAGQGNQRKCRSEESKKARLIGYQPGFLQMLKALTCHWLAVRSFHAEHRAS
ncbi:hypothetical protein BBD40_19320 [Paenibacillus ihbetae]|uniref:Uncharacterized protein n=1 Tax=Paenibacillus ihbetae TaxID=1870820 RepID=A0ABX3K309_9BACL|nr:hypothetical protein BBD40_19320 [Paenibacillus ihbetae]